MPKYPIQPPRKRRTREHVLADLSVNHVEKFALRCGFAVESQRHDYGIDLAVFTFDREGFLESGVLWIQLKATDQLNTTSDGSAVLVRIDRRDILAWIADLYPVFLVIYDAKRDRAYWISIQAYFSDGQAFRKLKGKTITIRIPAANLMNEDAMREFAKTKAALFAPQGERT